jgi:hypothetical protein
MTIEDVITQNEGNRITTNKLPTDDKCLGEPFRLRLFGVGYKDPPLATVP